MYPTFLPTTSEVRDLFMEVIGARGGTVTECVLDERQLFARSVLNLSQEVRRGDRLRAGVALMTLGEEVRIHPYTFREVCRNGAIVATALATSRLSRPREDAFDADVECFQGEFAAAVDACAAPDVFAHNIRQMRTALEHDANLMLQLLPLLRRFAGHEVPRMMTEIMTRFTGGRDASVFGLMNAVTSLARDTTHPRLRWDLEELGGAIPALLEPALGPDTRAASLAADWREAHAAMYGRSAHRKSVSVR
jgi:hypothetical protein